MRYNIEVMIYNTEVMIYNTEVMLNYQQGSESSNDSSGWWWLMSSLDVVIQDELNELLVGVGSCRLNSFLDVVPEEDTSEKRCCRASAEVHDECHQAKCNDEDSESDQDFKDLVGQWDISFHDGHLRCWWKETDEVFEGLK